MVEWISNNLEWLIFMPFVPFFLKDFLLMPFVIGEAKTKKDYFKTISVGVVIIALIFGYAWFMSLFE